MLNEHPVLCDCKHAFSTCLVVNGHCYHFAAVVNAENAGHRCEKFMQMAIRTRSAYLQELATQHITQQAVDTGSGSGLGEETLLLVRLY